MKRTLFLILIAAVVCMIGCAAQSIAPAAADVSETEVVETATAVPTATPDPTPTPVPTPSPTPEPQNRSITSGRVVPEGTLMRPFIMSIDNADGAKPQTALDQADIVYEFLVEASITRFQALYNDTYPVYAGPLRSIRYYFYDLAEEWDAMYIGSGYVVLKNPYRRIGAQILSCDLSNARVLTYKPEKGALNDYTTENGAKFRSGEPGRKSVHSLYVRVQSLINNFYQHAPEPEQRFAFMENISYEGAETFTSVSLPYASKDQPDWVQFMYDEETNRLYRFEGGNAFMNRVLSEDGTSYTEQQLSVQNLIVQHVQYSMIKGDNKGRRACELTGSGDCDYFINGQHLTGTWSRPTLDDYTQYLLDDGTLVTLEPGNTWIAMHPYDREITIYS